MYWNRFDICAAYYHYCHLPFKNINLQNYQWKLLNQLYRLRYRPLFRDRRLATLNLNSKALYMSLVKSSYEIEGKSPTKMHQVSEYLAGNDEQVNQNLPVMSTLSDS
ncbi:hypothetical protein [Dendronalium sp. ChiSLP03b]|uniref:hypothetical protein n=1 Tax=Dendronalium sp. ChiSLP03b TaxID=3075381 RepID=UPI002AD34427|nr:hypothetical protein [Dendronalium sp. ChiSLP03b]MDZ8205535.1 hypothetical protein [Dendronalium sp. ChiSLP03b]